MIYARVTQSKVGMDMELLQSKLNRRQGSCSADELIAFGRDISWQKRIIDYALAYSKK
jgi:hypothetical protein